MEKFHLFAEKSWRVLLKNIGHSPKNYSRIIHLIENYCITLHLSNYGPISRNTP